jgi:hypothetical protein
MHKHLANHAIFQQAVNNPIGTWLAFLRNWNHARTTRKAARKHAKIASTLSERILYDIGERDCRPPPNRAALSLWDHNPNTILIKAMLNQLDFDPRR